MCPWRNWGEWINCYHLIFGKISQYELQSDSIDLLKVKTEDLQEALKIINYWLMKNVGADQLKYLKMQKLILIQFLQLGAVIGNRAKSDLVQNDINMSALIFRLIQLVEMGAKTNQYKKSKLGGKLAMKNIAEELGFPKFLVQLRHQAVHESSQISLEIIELGLQKIQGYLLQSYWTPIWNKYRKRDQQIQVLIQQFQSYKLTSMPPPFDKMEPDERKKVLQKYTKGNLKLNIPLDLDQLVHLTHELLASTMNQIQVTFKDQKGFLKMIEEFGHSQTKHQMSNKLFDIKSYVEVKMKTQNTFACFLFYLEKKYQQKVCLILFQQIANHMTEYAKQSLQEDLDETKVDIERIKLRIVDQVRLVTSFILINQNTEYPFKKLAKQFETLKLAIGKLEYFKDVNFFSWFLLHKMQDKTLKQFKLVKLGEGLVIPVHIQDKQAQLNIENITPCEFRPLGQLLEQTYIESQVNKNPIIGNYNQNMKEQQKQAEAQEFEETQFDQRIRVNAEVLLL
ncbi:UNKNOWN [Stylonychia lemnae]|uniref:Las1-like family protein n=1 Tax=Stylonychia lemnae TaxID=5949 RepID=A0A078B0A6_STYLE|nr:UNKNOWN [Stylonychia lemnae]|eukprot:CDW86523.1 UNKNOWN [Stylonychia lemnae]